MKRWMVVVFAMLLVLSLMACGAEKTADDSQPNNADVTDTTDEDSYKENETDEPDQRGILGSNYVDITLGCEQFGLTDHPLKSAPDEAKDYYAHSVSSSATYSAIDATFDYSITMDGDFQVVSGTFGATWEATMTNETFVQAAATYLGFVSTMPYDAADSNAAKAWVTENIPSVADGDSISTTIGDAKLELYGTAVNGNYSAFWLDISKVQ